MNARQKLFVAEYLKDLNATQAAIRAGYAERSARVTGTRLLANAAVAAAVSKGQERRLGRVEATADRVVQELALIAFSDLGEAAEWGADGVRLLDSQTLEERVRRAIESVSETGSGESRRMAVKQHSKTKALELLGRHLGMFVDRQEHSFADGALSVEIVPAPPKGGA